MINFEYGSYKFEFDEYGDSLKISCNDHDLTISCYTFDLCEINVIYKSLDDYFEYKVYYDEQKELLEMLETEQCIEIGKEICEMLESNVRRATNDLYELLNGGYKRRRDIMEEFVWGYNETRWPLWGCIKLY